ncbi:hypothetical protein [Duganella sp. CF517]|uniref:hypothetical protein n=1 Tax=Duganella sp. CF517 TaxID=1881038 RepID=UPI000B7E5F30|nr:hypothetical protein [Duganella sp. CF517]
MPEAVIDILTAIFLDHFNWATGVCVILLATLASRKFLHVRYPYVLALCGWVFLLVSGTAVAAVLTIDFLSHGQGLERLALVVLFLGASPLFACALLAVFMFPRKSADFLR